MAHDVFISYASTDELTADAVCAVLESRGVRCWIAPRNILAGVPYGAAIVEAIQSSRIMVVVFSSHAKSSPQVSREIERAVHNRLTILPLRIEDVLPEGEMEFFLSSPHWLDAITPPLESHLQRLATTVQALLVHPPPVASVASTARPRDDGVSGHGAVAPPAPLILPRPAAEVGADGATPSRRRGPSPTLRGPYVWLIAGGAVFLLCLAVAAALLLRSSAAPQLTPAQLYNALLNSPPSRASFPPGSRAPAPPRVTRRPTGLSV